MGEEGQVQSLRLGEGSENGVLGFGEERWGKKGLTLGVEQARTPGLNFNLEQK